MTIGLLIYILCIPTTLLAGFKVNKLRNECYSYDLIGDDEIIPLWAAVLIAVFPALNTIITIICLIRIIHLYGLLVINNKRENKILSFFLH